jgi:transcription antitermination factor NusG
MSERELRDSQEGGADDRWFALSVKPRHEKSTSAALRFKGFQEFAPLYRSLRRWSDRFKEVELPLFAGYVFCRFDASRRLPILTTPGVLRIVGNGREPVPVLDSEIEALKAVAGSGLAAEPWPFLEVGSQIGIEEGPLRGAHGTLIEIKGRERLVLSVTLLRRSIAVEVDRRWVMPLASPNSGRALCAGA